MDYLEGGLGDDDDDDDDPWGVADLVHRGLRVGTCIACFLLLKKCFCHLYS